ncbi:MAG: hemerythrin domain-containing protein, partial [Candidatus Acidiferrales bacterium]
PIQCNSGSNRSQPPKQEDMKDQNEADVIKEFHSDHKKVIQALFELRQSIAKRNINEVRTILGGSEWLLVTHFKFEEHYLYPALQPFLGEGYVKKLFNEHDGIFRSVGRIAELARKEKWTDAETESAETNLELIYEHPIGCDGLSLWIERLSREQQDGLFRQFLKVQEQGTKFSEYRLERQQA